MLAQPQPDDLLGPWGKLGIIGYVLFLLTYLITKSGPKHLDEFRSDVKSFQADAKEFKTTVGELVEKFTNALIEKEASDAAERALDRSLITKIADQFTTTIAATLKDERERCRQERIEDWKRFQELAQGRRDA